MQKKAAFMSNFDERDELSIDYRLLGLFPENHICPVQVTKFFMYDNIVYEVFFMT